MKPALLKPLCEPDYLVPADQLPPSRPPGWMRLGLLATIAGLIVVAGVTLVGPMDETVAASGRVRPLEQQILHSAVDAVIKEIVARPGRQVTAGEVLVRLDAWEFDKRLTRLDAELAEAQASLRLAEVSRAKIEAVPVPPEFLFSELEQSRQQAIASIRRENTDRLEGLRDKGAASTLDVARERLQLIDAEAALGRSEQAKALYAGPYGEAARREAVERVGAARVRVDALLAEQRIVQAERDRCEVKAPRDGRVLSVTARLPGEPVETGESLVHLATGTGQELRLYATEDRLGRIEPGQHVRFHMKRQSDKLARPGRAVVSEVALDRDIGARVAGSRAGLADETYRITARVLSHNEPLPMGAEVEVEIIIREETFWRHMLRRVLPQ